MLSPLTEKTISKAIDYAKSQSHEYVSDEHILYALLSEDEGVKILKHCGADIKQLKKNIETFFSEHFTQSYLSNDELWQPEFTLSFQRLLQRAAIQVQSAGKREVELGNILVAIFEEEESFANYLLAEQNITRFDVIQYLSHYSSSKVISLGGASPLTIKESPHNENEKTSDTSFLLAFTSFLNEKAKHGKVDPLIGRELEIERALQILARRSKNNPLFVGESGVGKTALADGIALKIVNNEVPEKLRDMKIYSLDMGLLLAGTKYRGEFEERLKGVVQELKEQNNAVLFIDEIHSLIGAGSTSGGSLDASNLLKPALGSGEISCIGSTTYKEFRSHFEKDRALARRFQKIDVKEPTKKQSLAILEGLKSHFESYHEVKYKKASLKAAVDLSAKYIQNQFLPDKAIDVIDEAGARFKLQGKTNKTVQVKDIESVIASITQTPSKTISTSDRDKLHNLESKLKEVIFGQDPAIQQLVRSIKLARSGLNNTDKPVGSYLFAGPTGVGKTEVAKQLAQHLGVEFLRFDMSEYMEKHAVSRLVGAPPGYVGFDEGGLLTEAINKHPYSVILMDEIEKAHPDLINILLQVMDSGRLTDSNGRTADFTNAFIILTSNAGAFEAAKAVVGIQKESSSKRSLEAIKRQFSPEFINRLDAVVEFKELSKIILKDVIQKFVKELEDKLSTKKVSLKLDEDVYEWILNKAYDPAYGARPFQRVIDQELKTLLVDELLFGKLQKGGEARFTIKENKLRTAFDSSK